MPKTLNYQDGEFPVAQSAVVKKLNHFRFPQKDPSDFLGIYLPTFSISLNQSVESKDRDKLMKVRNDLYQELLKKLDSGKIGNIKFIVHDYIDLKYKHKEDPRRYLKIERLTNREGMSIVLCQSSELAI
jgi:hypothetical protein